jgi:hypothetical protein
MVTKIIDSLEQPAAVFYDRMSPNERRAIDAIIDDLKAYMEVRGQPYIIAGVGGLLRRENHFRAKDIDLAVAGMKYCHGKHDFSHVTEFTSDINRFFELLSMRDIDGNAPQEFTDGTGPLAQAGRIMLANLGGATADITARLGQFDNLHYGRLGSKGLRVQYPDMRPLDIQFIFNATPEEWISNQHMMREPFEAQHKLDSFPYAILYRSS